MRLLVANFFPAFHPPRSGGEQRYHYFYRHLSRHCDVTLLSPTYSKHAFEEVKFSQHLRERRVPKQRVFDQLHWELDAQGIGPECSAYVVALASALETDFADHFSSAAADADIIIHESPFTLPYDRTFGVDGKLRIYNAYNVEHRLARQILQGEAGRKAADFIGFLERALARNAALIFATSEEDRRLLAADFDIEPERIVLAPNGFEPADDTPRPACEHRDASRVLFIGSAHPPNVEAARFIVERIAPALPAVEFRLLGTVCGKLDGRQPGNVRLLGAVDEAAKQHELRRCTVAINPMFAGSGTNLKALDYLAAGAPVLTTPIGARGLPLVDGVTAFVAEGDDLVTRLREVLADAALRDMVGSAGRDEVLAGLTWSSIADHAYAAIERTMATRRAEATGSSARPTLLVVNDFPVAGGTSGGEVRIRELTIELGRDFDVVVLCLTQGARRTERRLAQCVREIAIPKTLAHRDAEIAASRAESVSVSDLVAAEHCGDNRDFAAAFRHLAHGAAAVVFEHPYLAPLLEVLPAGKPVVYSSLNVEQRLKADLLRSRRDAALRIRQAGGLERRMLERADLVVCVSEGDRDAFAASFPDRRYIVVENGVRTGRRDLSGARSAYPAGASGRRALGVFVGSAHSPNVEAAKFLLKVVAAAVPELDIALVGSVCSGIGRMPRPSNTHLLGILTEGEKNALLGRADLALNPLVGGGGSSLKVPDFFASGLPLVSTRIGVRGYCLRAGEHYIEADRGTFVARTRELIASPDLRGRVADNARRYAETQLDWRVLGLRYRRAMTDLLGLKPKPRVLIATYRFADPPPGGAETFMVNLLRELDRRGNVAVDVATCDVDAIADRWHFAAAYVRRDRAPAKPEYVDATFRFPVDSPSPDDFATCRRLFATWMRETREQAILLPAGAEGSRLLGGWNFPERHDGAVRRWSSREAQLRVGPTVTAIRIRGYAPRPTRVDILQGRQVVMSRALRGVFEWEVELADGERIVALRAELGYEADDDPRELGLLVNDIALRDAMAWESIPLEEDFETAARRSDPAAWVRSLVEVTGRRDRADDDLFFAVRGPRSRVLEHWLDANIGGYDVVLAQGTPFATPAVVAEIADRHRVPVVQLPHFHMEDRYYHWRRYYDMFRSARRVIAHSVSAKKVFFDAIGAASVAVPGGGIDPAEFAPTRLDRATAAFRALHGSVKPFVLVLGRKTGAKQYRLAVEAVAVLNHTGHRVDLVMIGPDEDGVVVAEPHTYCYGAQGRDVVLGALASALCLVNMSDSESFGIVLLESWLAGRPVIAQRRCMAFADLVDSGRNGLLVEAASETAAAIARYLDDGSLAAEHARMGRSVAEAHAWERVAEQVEAELIDAARAREGCESERERA